MGPVVFLLMAKRKVDEPKEDEKRRKTEALETGRVVSQFPCGEVMG